LLSLYFVRAEASKGFFTYARRRSNPEQWPDLSARGQGAPELPACSTADKIVAAHDLSTFVARSIHIR
jgi:hypothetical protein